MVLNRFLNFIVSIFLVRYLGPTQLGQYYFALVFASLFALFCDLGIGQLIICNVSQDRSRANRYLGSYLIIQLLLSILVLIAMFISVRYFKYPPLIKMAIYIAGLNLAVTALTQPFLNILIAFEKLRFCALNSIIGNIFYCMFILAAIYFHKGILVMIALTLAATSIEFILAVFVCFKSGIKIDFSFDSVIWKTLAKFFAPFAVYLVFSGLYRRIDVVMLERMQSVTAVGFYSVAYKIIFVFLLIPASFSKAVFPLLSEQANKAKEKFSQTISWYSKYLIALSLPLALGGAFFSQDIIYLLFGSKFLASAVVLKILIWSIVFAFWSSILSQALIASVNMVGVVSGTIIAFVFNVALNLILIPRYSYAGAAWSVVLTELFAALWFYLFLRRSVKLTAQYKEIIKIFLAGLIFVLASLLLSRAYFLFNLALSLISYLAVLWFLRFVSPLEIQLLKEAFLKSGNAQCKDVAI